MRHAKTFFSVEDQKRINQAVFEAEKHTSGEIIPVVATASGDYDRAEDLVGLWTAVIGLGVQWWLMLPPSTRGDWKPLSVQVSQVELLMMLGVLVGCFLLGAAVASHVGWLRRLFTTRSSLKRCVEKAASAIFFEQGIRNTKDRTGILIYLSLFERMVRVAGDQAISEHLSDKDWEQVRDLILEGLKKGQAADGMILGIRRCGEILAKQFPVHIDDRNELPNELRIVE